jgi:hypothetical protein
MGMRVRNGEMRGYGDVDKGIGISNTTASKML